ncbi:chaplin family protein [Streptomyces roseolilacinus]|uniref:chaplin family protein n=1 Tax=Streptomyces roseolilacinus TaxID=66904 RepID=UPI00380B1E28
MATGGAFALAAGSAHADADAFAAAFDSTGLVTGDETQLPMDSPVSVCGDTVNAEGLLNPAAGNTCANEDEARGSHKPGTPRAGGGADGGATAFAGMIDSSGAFSGDGIKLPVDSPAKVSGDAVSIVIIGDPASGHDSGGKPPEEAVTPPKPAKPAKPAEPAKPAAPPESEEPAAPMPVEEAPAPADAPSLAATGAGNLVGMGLPAAGLVLAGTLLYRRSRSSAARA